MAVTSGTMMAMSAGMNALGQLQQGRAQKAAGDVQAQQDRLRAGQEMEAAQQEAGSIRRAGRRTAGAARAQMAANGVNVNSGTPLAIEDEIGYGSEKDALNTLLTGQRRAGAYNFNAGQAETAGRNYKRASELGAITTGLQGWKGVKQPTAESQYRYKVPTYDGAEY